VLIVNDVVNVMAAYQPVVQVCGTRWRKELNSSVGTIKKCFETIDARCKHEDKNLCLILIKIITNKV